MKQPKNRVPKTVEEWADQWSDWKPDQINNGWKLSLDGIWDSDLIDLIGRIQELQAEYSWFGLEMWQSTDGDWISFCMHEQLRVRDELNLAIDDLLTFDPVRPHGFIGDPDELASELSSIIKEMP